MRLTKPYCSDEKEEEIRQRLTKALEGILRSVRRSIENLEGLKEDIRKGKFPPPQPPYKQRDIIQDLF